MTKLETLKHRPVALSLRSPLLAIAGCLTTLLTISCAAPETKAPETQNTMSKTAASKVAATLIPVGDAPHFYGGQVLLPAGFGTDLKAAALDLQDALQKMTGRKFEGQTAPAAPGVLPARGIVLLRADSKLAPADIQSKLENQGREAFMIRSDGGERLLIVANRDEGLSHGIYFFLEQLGARYYFPTEKWTIFPSRKNVAVKIDHFLKPEFKLRDFFGTGGLGRGLPVDPDGAVPKAWDNWRRRNRFGGEYLLRGHSGDAFNIANKKTLLEHPEYLANVDGKFLEWSSAAKLNPANADAVKLYADWSVERMRKARQTDPNGRDARFVSVDPSDGGGHCNSEECKKIGNGSATDQIFYIANEVAKAVKKEFPDGWVNLYAYNEHASIPSFPLEPNVYVQVIPYAFQQSGLAPEDLISQWSRKAPRLGIYDYWGMTDWSYDLPTFDYSQTPREKIRFWHNKKIEGFLGESSYSAGAMGLAWYVSSRLLWEPETNAAPIIAEFYQNAFGPARAPMQQMLERWAGGFVLSSQELAASYRDLKNALQLAQNNDAVRARILDYARYVHYQQLLFEMRELKPQSAERSAAAIGLMHYVMSIYDSTMISGFRVFQGINRYDTTDWKKNWEEVYSTPNANTKAAGPGWDTISILKDEDVFAMIESGLQKYSALPFERRFYAGALQPISTNANTIQTSFSPALSLQNAQRLEVVVSGAQQNFALQLQGANAKSDAEIRVTVMNEKFAPVSSEITQLNAAAPTQIKIALPQPGHYFIHIGGGNQNFKLQLPANIPVVMREWANHPSQTAPRLYFYVPTDLKKLAIYNPHQSVKPPMVLDSSGQTIAPEITTDGGKVLIYPIATAQSGKIWALEKAASPKGFSLQLLNAPSIFSLFPDTLLVPKDALK